MDFAYLTAQTLGDRDLERELLELFVAQARVLIEALPDRSPGDQEAAAHLLKGSAHAVGAAGVADAAAAYEEAGRSRRGRETPVYGALVSAFEDTGRAIAAHLASWT